MTNPEYLYQFQDQLLKIRYFDSVKAIASISISASLEYKLATNSDYAMI